jgi:predicted alpha-1,6-mannanase (GH76 family)
MPARTSLIDIDASDPSVTQAIRRRANRLCLIGALVTATIMALLSTVRIARPGWYSDTQTATPTLDMVAAAVLLVALIVVAIVATNRPAARQSAGHPLLRGAAYGATTVAAIATIGALAAASGTGQVLAPPRAPVVAIVTSAAHVDYRPATMAALHALMDDYQHGGDSDGRWGSSWWTTATTMDALITAEQTTGDRSYVADIEHTYDTNASFGDAQPEPVTVPWGNHYADDSAWWGLAWLHAYQLTGDARMLTAAEGIDDYVASFWDTTCGGGVKWALPIIVSGSQKNAITNETYLQLSAELAVTTHQPLYLTRAQAEWTWLSHSGLIRPDHLVTDHLDDQCRPTSIPLSYTQGPILPGLLALSQATGDRSLLATARTLADASTTYRPLNPSGVLAEPCEQAQRCAGDAEEFKGSYVQALGVLNRALPQRPYSAYLIRQAATIQADDRMVGDLYGTRWAGPPDAPSPVRQATAVSALASTLIGEQR